MRKFPKDAYLQSLKPEPYLGSDRKFYQGQLEQLYPDLDFALLDDTALMNLYEADEVVMDEAIGEYYDLEV